MIKEGAYLPGRKTRRALAHAPATSWARRVFRPTNPRKTGCARALSVLISFTMKTLSLWRHLLVPLASTIAISAFAGSASSGRPSSNVQTGPNVRIEFTNPKYFTDIKIHDFDEWKSAKIFGNEMTEALSPVVAKAAPGCTLILKFTDIDLGGRYEPWKPQHSQIRYEPQWLPLRMSFDYTVLDSRGRVLSQGTKSLSKTLYLGWSAKGNFESNWDYLYYEKQELLKWAEQNVRA
jgi:hypothetical protein